MRALHFARGPKLCVLGTTILSVHFARFASYCAGVQVFICNACICGISSERASCTLRVGGRPWSQSVVARAWDVVAPPWVVVATHIRCLSSKATPSNLSLTIIASNLAPQPSETSTQLCVVTQRGGERHAGDSLTLTEAHHIRCRERSCQLGYERRGVVCHVMQDLCRCRLLVRPLAGE